MSDDMGITVEDKLITFFLLLTVKVKEGYKEKTIKDEPYLFYKTKTNTWSWGTPGPSKKFLEAIESTEEDLLDYVVQRIQENAQLKMF